jgi:hypothetical protein
MFVVGCMLLAGSDVAQAATGAPSTAIDHHRPPPTNRKTGSRHPAQQGGEEEEIVIAQGFRSVEEQSMVV